MSTKSNKSAGSQFTPKGVTQGVTLVDQKSGDPIGTVEDSSGVKRLAVDANFTAQNVQAEVELDFNEDSVEIGDSSTGNTMNINDDGSIDANVEVDAADGDNVGLKVQERNASPSDAQYTKRVTAVTGSQDTTHTSMDVALHDREGNGISSQTSGSIRALDTVPKAQLMDGVLRNILAGGFDTTNSHKLNLIANESWNGTYRDVRGQNTVFILAVSNQPLSSIVVRWSPDGLNSRTGVLATQVIPKTATLAGTSIYVATLTTLVDNYFRLEVVNGSTGTALFEADSWIYDKPFAGTFLTLDGTLNTYAQALLTRSVMAGIKPDGQFANVGISSLNSLRVQLENSPATSSYSTPVEGFRDDISIKFFENGALDKINNLSVGGTVTQDFTQGQLVVSTGVTPGNTAIARSIKTAIYEPGHQIIGEQTFELNTLPTGDASVFWGFSDGNNALGYYLISSGLYILRKKNGVIVDQIPQASWNRDACLGQTFSGFIFNGNPQSLAVLNNNLYRTEYEWLGVAPPKFILKAPNDARVLAHVIEAPNQGKGTTISNPELPLCIEIKNDSISGGNLEVRSGSWRGGINTSKVALTGKNPNEDYTEIRTQGRDPNNSSSIPLLGNTGGSDHIYRGKWFRWQNNYVGIIVDVSSDVQGTLHIDFAQIENPSNIDESSVIDTISDDYIPGETPLFKIKIPLQSKWVRVRYVNGLAAQSLFELDTAFVTSDPGLTQFPLSKLPNLDHVAGITRAVLTVTNGPDADFKDYPMSAAGHPQSSIEEIHDDIAVKPLDSSSASQIVVGSGSAVRLDPSPLANRRAIRISNEGPGRVAWGHSQNITFDSNSIRMKVGRVEHLLLAPNLPLYAIAENTGGAQNTLQRIPGAAPTGSGTTNPANAQSSNNVYANMTANGNTITATTFTAGTTNALVAVRLGLEGNKQSGQTETVSIAEIQNGSTTGSGTVTTASLAGGTNQLYVVIVSRNDSTGTITSVTAGGVSLAPTSQINIASGNRRLDVWFAYGNFSSGAASATLSGSTNAHIVAYRIVNASSTTPIQAINSTTGTGTAVTGPAIGSTVKGAAILVVNHGDGSGTAGVGYVEDYDQVNGSGSNTDGLITASKVPTTTGTETGTYTLASSSSWAAIGLTITPAAAIDPIITLSYTLSGNPGTTSGQVTLISSTDSNFTIDVTGDRSWVVGDIALVNVIATATSIGGAAANIDLVYLELVDSSGNVARISVWQGAKAVS